MICLLESWDSSFDETASGNYLCSILLQFLYIGYFKLLSLHWEKNAIEPIAFLSKSMYITDSNQYAIELVTYLLVLVVYFYELIVYMLL